MMECRLTPAKLISLHISCTDMTGSCCDHWTRMVLTAGLAIAALPAPVWSQTATGAVTDAATGSPIAGVFIRLLDEAGRQRSGVLSDSAGAFLIRAPAAGRYRLQAERIGHVTVTSDVLELAAGENRRSDVAVPVRPVSLDRVAIVARSRCRIRPESGPETQLLWEEARKVLGVAAWTLQTGWFHYEVSTFRQQLDRAGKPSARSRADTASGYGPRPFVTPAAEELNTRGFIRAEGTAGAHFFYVPDAEILLSDAFLSTHCFWVERSPEKRHEGMIGLGFEPIRGHTRPDITGVLWLDAATAELRLLEFGYTSLPWDVDERLATGRIEFRRTPAGAWIIQTWRVRIPRVEFAPPTGVVTGRRTYQHIGFEEAGGEVRALRRASGRRSP